jgi:hypothetical protein
MIRLLHRNGVWMNGIAQGDGAVLIGSNRWGKTSSRLIKISLTEFSNVYWETK